MTVCYIPFQKLRENFKVKLERDSVSFNTSLGAIAERKNVTLQQTTLAMATMPTKATTTATKL